MNATTQPSARAASAVHFATVLLGAVVALTTVGCKSDAERACEKLAASGDAQADDTACVTELQQTLDACENKEKAVACFSDLRPGDVEAALACRAICDDDAGQLLAMADEVKKHEAEKEAERRRNAGKSKLSRCMDECQAKHGPLMDKPAHLKCMEDTGNDVDTCSARHINSTTGTCLRTCQQRD